MTPATLVIVADRGSLKAYRVNETETRGPSLQLVLAFDVTDAHGRYQDKLTDVAGRFSGGNGGANGGRHMSSIAERQNLETETDRRIFKQLADSIAEVVKEQGSEGWSFAAPGAIQAAIVDQLPREVRDRIVEHVPSDLVKLPVAELTGRFRSLQRA